MTTRNKPKKKLKAWLQDHLNDPYVKLAQKDGYRARAAYKLQEIDEALGLLKPGQTVVDLGAAPGAWSQYLRRRLAGGTIVALDMLDFEPIEGVTFIQGDFRETAALAALDTEVAGRALDLVVSDMAPNLSGIASADAARMTELVELAIEFAVSHLAPGGTLVCKAFHGSGYSQLVESFKRAFKVVKPLKPRASRARSSETFLIGIGPKRLQPASDLRNAT